MNAPSDDFAAHPQQEAKTSNFAAYIRDNLLSVFIIWAIWALVSNFLISFYVIPSASMVPATQVGDRVLASRLTPRFFDLQRGDIVVFRDDLGWIQAPKSPNSLVNGFWAVLEWAQLRDSGTFLEKRVIGLPGDSIDCAPDTGMMINGKKVDESSILPPNTASCGEEFHTVVPAERIWVMGDNRANSVDSRYHMHDAPGATGSVAISSVRGIVKVRVWPITRIGSVAGGHDIYQHVPAPKPQK